MPRLNKPLRPRYNQSTIATRELNADPFYQTQQWRRLSKRVAIEEPLCRLCLEDGNTVAGQCTDHIVPRRLRPDLSLERTNLQRLCNRCHAIKSAKEGKINK
jgi:5-methylcytosine-specific restriction endonuclease McrA